MPDSFADDDPFGCFGSDDEGLNSGDRVPSALTPASGATPLKPNVKPVRDDDCGVLSFHQGTEAALLAHVQNAVDGLSLSPVDSNDDVVAAEAWEGSPKDVASATVLTAVDAFCHSRHWMMHVGPEKGAEVSDTLRRTAEDAADQHLAQSESASGRTRRRPFVAVELGTYCGYASVLLGRSLFIAAANAAKRGGDAPDALDFHLYTVEVNPPFLAIAREIVKLARLDDKISFLQIPLNPSGTSAHGATANALSEIIGKDIEARQTLFVESHDADDSSEEVTISHGLSDVPQIDFLFIDHDKDMYLPDLQSMEKKGLVRVGTTVVADNVIFARIDDYLAYVKKRAEQGVTTTETIAARIEYSHVQTNGQDDDDSDLFRDGIEVTRYLSTP